MKSLKYWDPKTFEATTYQFKIGDRANKKLNSLATDTSGSCEYSFNELGFRGESISKDGFKVMSFGCSFTEGAGVNDSETWPAQFCSLIPNSVNLNFGFSGKSSDFVTRCLLTFFDTINPDLVLIMYPNPFRREIYTRDNGVESFMPTVTWGYLAETEDGKDIQKNLVELQNDNEDFINWYKNHLLIKYFLQSKNCNFIWNGSRFITSEYIEENRFDGDYEKFIDLGSDGLHPGPLHNKSYAVNLYNFILNKFPDYLNFKDKKRKIL